MKSVPLVMVAGIFSVPFVFGQEQPLSLEAAREQGRVKSRYTKETKTSLIAADAAPKANTAEFQRRVLPILTESCLGCHGPKVTKGNFRIDQLNPDVLTGPDAERWQEVSHSLGKSEMPPENDKKVVLSDRNRTVVLDWLREELDKASQVRRTTKRHSSFRRLTNYEYDYAIQDLLGVPFRLPQRLPPESVTEDGFKNSSELLQMTGNQFEIYRDLALKALRRATVVGDRPKPVVYTLSVADEVAKLKETGEVPNNKAKGGSKNNKKSSYPVLNRETGKVQATLLEIHKGDVATGVEFAIELSPKGVAGQNPAPSPFAVTLGDGRDLKLDLDRYLPDSGVMHVRIRAARSNANPEQFASLRLLLSAHTSNNANFTDVISQRDVPVTATAKEPQWIEFDVLLDDLQRNPFRNDPAANARRDEFLHIRNVSSAGKGNDRLSVEIEFVEIVAPYFEQWPPKSHTNIFFESPNKKDEKVYGREVLRRFLRRAWRRPVAAAEVDRYLALFQKYRPEFKTFDETMIEVLATALASPEFLYLAQRSATDAKAPPTRLGDCEFATRLAIFLWSSIPDEELLKLAETGELRKPKVLEAQVTRMLADPRSKRFSEGFTEQWLGLDGLKNATHIPAGPLKDAIREEPIAFFREVLANNRSVIDFIHSDYSVVNEPLATHYGIPKVYGPAFRKVAISPGVHRGGVLTDAAILAMNANAKDSNPLKRGVWVLKNILNDPPPPPPPDVPTVDLTNPKILQMTLKERIADHRNKAACASCHSRIDPWGIAFENYDSLGAYRTKIKNVPVDATSELFNRQTLSGMDGLKRYLLSERQDQFVHAVVCKMAAYALGRPSTLGDRAEIERMTAEVRRRGDGLADVVRVIVTSELFHSK